MIIPNNYPIKCPKCDASLEGKDINGEYRHKPILVIYGGNMKHWECPYCDYVWEHE